MQLSRNLTHCDGKKKSRNEILIFSSHKIHTKHVLRETDS